jgi:hypothetical protein
MRKTHRVTGGRASDQVVVVRGLLARHAAGGRVERDLVLDVVRDAVVRHRAVRQVQGNSLRQHAGACGVGADEGELVGRGEASERVQRVARVGSARVGVGKRGPWQQRRRKLQSSYWVLVV